MHIIKSNKNYFIGALQDFDTTTASSVAPASAINTVNPSLAPQLPEELWNQELLDKNL